jgi:hypothetical protein
LSLGSFRLGRLELADVHPIVADLVDYRAYAREAAGEAVAAGLIVR